MLFINQKSGGLKGKSVLDTMRMQKLNIDITNIKFKVPTHELHVLMLTKAPSLMTAYTQP